MEEIVSKSLKCISRKEWLFVAFVMGAIASFTSGIFFYGYTQAGPDTYFSGMHSLAPGDYSVYFSYILQAYDGHVLFRDLYTTESASYNMLNIFWLAAGLLGSSLRLHPQIAFHAARIISIFVLGVCMYLFIAYVFHDVRVRRWSFLLACLSGGISAYVAPLFDGFEMSAQGYLHRPMDLWVAESNAFLSMLHSGHMVLSTTLTILTFYLYIRAVDERRYMFAIFAGIAASILTTFHPFQVPVIAAVILGYVVFRSVQVRRMAGRELISGVIVGALMLPVVLYYSYMLANDPLTAIRSAQNNNLTPAWYLLFLSFGIPFMAALWYATWFIRSRKRDGGVHSFIVSWFLVQTVLLYAPVNFQRRMVEGLFFPVILLFAMSVPHIHQFIRARMSGRVYGFATRPIVLICGSVLLFGMSNLFVAGRDGVMYSQHPTSVYIDRGITDPILSLRPITGEDDILFGEMNISHLIPGLIGRTVYAGHNVETSDIHRKEQEISDFFFVYGPERQEEFIQEHKLTYILYGPREWVGDGRWRATVPGTEDVGGSDAVRVLRVLAQP